ncbi:CPBP family intramembrane metalloprotease [Nocardia sp. PE-7]|uniref:CPBP family intramembrane glutamic endopeptidase n=1 Tax=Nocardia sp. PE-7 TaxID=3058426 RepID=UPI002659BA3B|nr:CPBP family intramembrane glutamic endopeptidase [Nocardia sp. PE-7]WKG09389.1 CPBP family intramembrane metalloprotease [Nocardia sp. PE-7]
MTDTVPVSQEQRGLRGFMNRGGFWRFLAFVVVYLAIYLAAGFVIGRVGGHYVDDDLLSSLGSVFVQVTAALIVGAIVLAAFSAYLGWNRELYGRQPIYRSKWMWIAPVIVGIPIVLRVLGIDWGRHQADIVALMLVTGLLVGFVEELTYRGFGVKMLREAGHGELVVAALTSLAFALSHSTNLLGGQSIKVVGPTILYTFSFGVLMYLTMRVTGFLLGAMVMHGLTDPTTMLATGGVDEVATDASSGGFLQAAGLFTMIVIISGYLLVLFVRGRVTDQRPS